MRRLRARAGQHGLALLLLHHDPDAFTQLGAALHFYGVDLRYAPTPQAKGKVERRHGYWQKRLPALLAADHILELCGANQLLDQLVPPANAHEIHREIGTAPQAVRTQALAEKRSVLRPGHAGPWWPFVWSQRTRVRVGDDGKVPVGAQRHALDVPLRTTVIRCFCAQTETTITSAKRPIPQPNPRCYCTAQSSNIPVSF